MYIFLKDNFSTNKFINFFNFFKISFPTTLQPRNDRFDLWRGQGGLTAFGNTSSAKYSSDTTGSSRGSSMGSSIAHSPGGSSVTVSTILLLFPVLVTSGQLLPVKCVFTLFLIFFSPHFMMLLQPIL